ncbi:hypothetical protein PC116_g27677 [Phytophthora cactorum]|nr:hypothetical protein PC111_g25083 [Phytophthora cactorum]KAG4223861.1 hypothetical protein PC116_g27677 [Phytophthora cactorum]
MGDLERRVQLSQREQAQSTARGRCVEERVVRVLRETQEVTKSAAEVLVEAFQLLLERPKVAKGVLNPRVEVHLHRLHHLPRSQPRLHQRRSIALE